MSIKERMKDILPNGFFEQPCGYTLADVRHSRNVTLGARVEIPGLIKMHSGPNPSMDFFNTESKLHNEWKLLFQKNVRINAKTRDFILDIRSSLGLNQNTPRICGVLCRGTDYRNKPGHHPIQPEVDEVIQKTSETCSRFSCTHVFLATEDAMLAKQFYDAFGEKLVMAFPPDASYKGEATFHAANISPYRSGLQYLCTLDILSSCTCIIGTACGGSMMATLMAEKPEYEYYFWRGLYGVDDVDPA